MKPLQILARRMFPDFVHESYPQAITFMEKVFEYMDMEGNQYDIVSNLLAYNDVDTTLEKFESVFRDQYLANFPDVLAADVDLLVKNIRSFYLNKGTEQSYRFLFGALFNSTVNFWYPKFNILRASDGLWFTPQYLVITDANNNLPPQLPDTTSYPVFKLIDKFITGTESGAVAFVDGSLTLSSVGLTYGGSGNVEAISTVESEGEFIPGEQILIGNTLVQNGSFDQDLAFWDINPAGDAGFYTVDNQLVIEQRFGNIKTRYVSQAVEVQEGFQYWIRFTLAAADFDECRVTVGYAPGDTSFYDSGDIGLNAPYSLTVPPDKEVLAGKTHLYITLWNEMTSAYATCTFDGISLVPESYLNQTPIMYVAQTGIKTFGNLQFFDSDPDTIGIDSDEFTNFIQDGDDLTISDSSGSPSNEGTFLVDTVATHLITLDNAETLVAEGTYNIQATLSHDESGVLTGIPDWKDLRGFLSEGDFVNRREIVLQDGDLYQDFSYVLFSQVSIDRFESIVKDLLHPSGFKLFARVVAADGLIIYSLRESWYDDLVFTNDGGGAFNQAKVTRTASGKPFDVLFRPNDRVRIGDDGAGASITNAGTYSVDTVDSTTMVFKSGLSFAGGDFTGTLIKVSAGVGIIEVPLVSSADDGEWFNYQIEDPIGINESYYTTLVITDNITIDKDANDGKDFDLWIVPDQPFVLGRTFDPAVQGKHRAVTVTADKITVDPLYRELVAKDYTSIANPVKITRGIIPHTGNAGYIEVIFDIEWETQYGFGVTWEQMESRRTADMRIIADWASLIIGDFNTKATSRFGFINPWEIDVVPFIPPSSNDPDIVWDFDNPGYVESLWINGQADALMYFYPSSNLMEGPYPSATALAMTTDTIYHQQCIHDDATPFNTGDFLGMWEKDTLYNGSWDNLLINFNQSADGTWYDLRNLDVRLSSDNNPADGVQHMRIKMWVATDDGFGAPVTGSDTYKYVTFYALGISTSNDRELESRMIDTNGTALPSHTPYIDTQAGGWIAVDGGLEIQSNDAIGNTAGKNSAVLDVGSTQGEMKLRMDIQAGDNFSLFIRTDATADNGYELEIDQAGAEPILKLWQLDSGTPTLRDSIEMTGATFNGWDQYVQLTVADADDIVYGEFFEDVGQNPMSYYVEYTDTTHTALTHCGFSLDEQTNRVETAWFDALHAHTIPRFLPLPVAP